VWLDRRGGTALEKGRDEKCDERSSRHPTDPDSRDDDPERTVKNTIESLCITTLFAAASAGAATAQITFNPAPAATLGAEAQDAALADLDGDGFADLAATVEAPDRIALSRGNGDGTFSAVGSILVGASTSPHSLVAGDFDGDGDQDLAVTLEDLNSVRVYRNDGGFAFTQVGSAATGAGPRHLAVGDHDGDGDLDLVVSNRDGNSITVLTNGGTGLLTSQTVACGAEPRQVVLFDSDGDGDLDAAVAAHDARRVDLFVNTGGAFAAGATLSTGLQFRPDGLVAADLEGDGDTDLVAAGDANGVPQLLVFSNGPTGFAPFVSVPVTGQNPSFSVAADLDQDGDTDIAVLCTDSGTVALMANDGAGALAFQSSLTVGADPQHVVLGDADGNGALDLAVADQASGTATIFLGTALCGGFPYGLAAGGANTGTIALDVVPTVGQGVGVLLGGFQGDGFAILGLSAFSKDAPGFAGGTLLIDVTALLLLEPVLITGGTGGFGLNLPNDPNLAGVSVFMQAAMFDGVGPQGWSLTHGLEMIICG